MRGLAIFTLIAVLSLAAALRLGEETARLLAAIGQQVDSEIVSAMEVRR